MPRGGRRPGAGRPKEGYEGRLVYVALRRDTWGRLERFLKALEGRYPYRSRLLGWLLMLGAEEAYERHKRERKVSRPRR